MAQGPEELDLALRTRGDTNLRGDADTVAWCTPYDAGRWALGTPYGEVDASSAADNDGKVYKTAGSSSADDLKA